MTSIGVIRAIVVCLKANMVVKTTAIYIPLRTVQEKQYFVIRDEETKSRRALALATCYRYRYRYRSIHPFNPLDPCSF